VAGEKHYSKEILKVDKKILKNNEYNQLSYSLFGSETIGLVVIRKFPSVEKKKIDSSSFKRYFMEEGSKWVNINPKLVITSDVHIPLGYPVHIKPGTDIIFRLNGQLVFHDSVHFEGADTNRITVTSENKASSGGILVLNAPSKSFIKYTDFLYLKGVYLPDRLITGAVNFYQSNVVISNSTFSHNYNNDDYINIVDSQFSIHDVVVSDSFSDSIDIDFGIGDISNLKINSSGNDALDFSESYVKMKIIKITGSKDKALSIGEGSTVELNNIHINDSFIGIATKDGSVLKAEDVVVKDNRYDFVSFIKKPEYGMPMLEIDKFTDSFTYVLGKGSEIKINGKNLTKITENVKELFY